MTPEYLAHACNLSARISFEARTPAGFTPYECESQTMWWPYRNVLSACQSYVGWRAEIFLSTSCQYALFAPLPVWGLLEYDALHVADVRRRGDAVAGTWAFLACRVVVQTCSRAVGLLALIYACTQATASSWTWVRMENVHFLGTGNHQIMQVAILVFTFLGVGVACAESMAAKVAMLWQPEPADDFDCFLTHDWGAGQANHARVSRINATLKSFGFRTWFDEERMVGDIEQQMTHGIDHSKMVIVFVTQRYIQKVAGKDERGEDDNCKFEFDYACKRKGVASMLTVVMERECMDTSTWEGKVGGKLGSRLYIDATGEGNEVLNFAAQRIAHALAKAGVGPMHKERTSRWSRQRLLPREFSNESIELQDHESTSP